MSMGAVEITVAGKTHQFILGGIGFSPSGGNIYDAILEGYNGFGMPPVKRISERGPLQHGITDLGFRLHERIIQLVFVVFGSDDSELWQNRSALVNLFKPRDEAVVLGLPYLPIGARSIECHYVGDMTLPSQDKRGYMLRVGVSLQAAEPTWYDPALQAVNFGLTGGGTGWGIPWVIAWTIGAGTLNQLVSHVYPGSFLTYPVIRIRGPITDPVLTNETTDEKLDFTGVILGISAYLDIDCRYGYKTVIDETGANRIADLTDDSDLSTFHLEADPDAPGGINDLRMTGSGVNSATAAYMTYHIRYTGI